MTAAATTQTTSRDEELAKIQRSIRAASEINGLTNDEQDQLVRAAHVIFNLRIREMRGEA